MRDHEVSGLAWCGVEASIIRTADPTRPPAYNNKDKNEAADTRLWARCEFPTQTDQLHVQMAIWAISAVHSCVRAREATVKRQFGAQALVLIKDITADQVLGSGLE